MTRLKWLLFILVFAGSGTLQTGLQAAAPPGNDTPPDPVTAFNQCAVLLKSQGVIFTRLESFQADKGCGIQDPVKITAIVQPDKTISLPSQPMLSCRFALRLAIWLADVGAPIIQSFQKAPLEAISSGPGYICRNRYNRKNGKLSEHAYGNAIDINGFLLAGGKRIAVSKSTDGTDIQKRMLMALRISSCGYFTTVLGPGANAAHKNHFHIDLGKHGRTWNYRICE